jgi:L-histidine N-alpha-methyltransferase
MAGGTTTAAQRWSVQPIASAMSRRERLERDVREGLAQRPPTIPPRWFYDEKGAALFDDITRLPEYYPTRAETEILRARGTRIADITDASTLVEFGSGTSTKTRILIDALTAEGRPLTFVPLDVSVEVLTDAARTLAVDYPTLTVEAHVADFEDPLPPLPGTGGRRLVAFLGGTIGNFTPAQRHDFLSRLRAALEPGDHLLLGADLVKDADRLVAAYDDAAGVTAAFNRNVIDVLSRELHARGLAADDFDHVARWNEAAHRIEMWLRARVAVTAQFPTLGLSWSLAPGEEVLTEISAKFTVPQLRHELRSVGFEAVEAWTDAAGDFALILARADAD